MMKIDVYSEKSGSFASESEKKPMIIIESKRKSLESLKAKYPDAMIIDVTSHFIINSLFFWGGGHHLLSTEIKQTKLYPIFQYEFTFPLVIGYIY